MPAVWACEREQCPKESVSELSSREGGVNSLLAYPSACGVSMKSPESDLSSAGFNRIIREFPDQFTKGRNAKLGSFIWSLSARKRVFKDLGN